jgi:hypothetical protein
MFSNLDTTHSYDPFALARLIYQLFFGGATTVATGTSSWVTQVHNSFSSFFNSLPFFLINAFAKYAVFSFFLSLALFVILIMYIIRERNIRKEVMSRILPAGGEVERNVEESVLENAKWKLIESHINSEDPDKWKLAIIEADIILGELLDSLHLLGEGIGEKLKNVEASDFDHLEEAWEAHKIRNAIAHQGSDFLLTKREAKRITELYKVVFEEFEII